MATFLDFVAELPAEDCFKDSVLVLFQSIGSFNPHQLDAAISRCLQDRLKPDRVIVLVPEPKRQEVVSSFEEAPLIDAKERDQYVRSVAVISYDKGAQCSAIQVVRGSCSWSLEFVSRHLGVLKNAGLRAISLSCAESNVLISAPPGFIFDKPSSDAASYFIRAENVIVNLEAITFLAFCLLDPYEFFCTRHGRPPESIFVDSMSIVSVALGLRQLRNQLAPKEVVPEIHSFHSYDGLSDPNFRSPTPGSAFVLISASTSCNLTRAWSERTSCEGEDTVTMFSFRPTSPSQPVLFTLEKPPAYQKFSQQQVADSGKRRLKIVGEHFLSQFALPRSVIIGVAHAPKEFWSDFKDLQVARVIDCHRGKTLSGVTRETYVDGQRLVAVPAFKKWLKEQLVSCQRGGVDFLIYQNDPASQEMKDLCIALITELAMRPPIALSENELRLRQEEMKGLVLVLSAVASRGSKLLSISRDLRVVHQFGPRVFLVGAMTSPTTLEQRQLISNLSHSPPLSRYAVACFRSFVVGRLRAATSWLAEHELLSRAVTSDSSPELKARLDTLAKTGDGLGDAAFWPSTADGNPLKLRDGFAFWDGEGGGSAASVYFTIANVLQSARENANLPPLSRLDSSEFQHVVLAPQVFERFNDGIIQSAILRAANPAELDFSGDEGMSEEMGDILFRIISSYKRERGEAAMEFVIALATKRLRLTVGQRGALLKNLYDSSEMREAPAYLNAMLNVVILGANEEAKLV